MHIYKLHCIANTIIMIMRISLCASDYRYIKYQFNIHDQSINILENINTLIKRERRRKIFLFFRLFHMNYSLLLERVNIKNAKQICAEKSCKSIQ